LNRDKKTENREAYGFRSLCVKDHAHRAAGAPDARAFARQKLHEEALHMKPRIMKRMFGIGLAFVLGLGIVVAPPSTA